MNSSFLSVPLFAAALMIAVAPAATVLNGGLTDARIVRMRPDASIWLSA